MISLIDLASLALTYLAAFYARIEHHFALVQRVYRVAGQTGLQLPDGSVNIDAVQEISNIVVVDGTPKDALNIALDYCRNHDGLNTFSRLIETFLADAITPEQRDLLVDWDIKLEAVIAISKITPQAADFLQDQLNQISNGTMSLQDLDDLIHVALRKPTKQQEEDARRAQWMAYMQ